MKRKPKRDLDERHKVPVGDPENGLAALLGVDPEASPDLSEEQVAKAVNAALNDPDIDGPPPRPESGEGDSNP